MCCTGEAGTPDTENLSAPTCPFPSNRAPSVPGGSCSDDGPSGKLLETPGSNHHDVISAAALPSCPDSTSKGINTENHTEAGKGTSAGTLLLWPDPQRVCRPLLHVAYHTHQRTLGQAQPCSLDRKGSVHRPWADPSRQPRSPPSAGSQQVASGTVWRKEIFNHHSREMLLGRTT